MGNKRSAKKPAAKAAPRKAAASKKAAKKAASKKKAAPKKVASSKKAAKKAVAKKAAPKSAKKAASQKKAAKKAPAKARSGGKAAKKVAAKAPPKLRPVGRRKTVSASVPPEAPDDDSKRNFGLRGAAPWVARHAAKHAEELRRRNAEPPPPGSARATLRVPPEAEKIKSRVGELHQLTSRIRNLRKKLDKNFYEIGELLAEVQQKELHVAKGYSTFESFLDREVELPRSTSLRLIRIAHTFHQETAYDFGMDRLTMALAALDGEVMTAPSSHPSSRGWSSAALPPKPPIRFDD